MVEDHGARPRRHRRLDSSIILPPPGLAASGHVGEFHRPARSPDASPATSAFASTIQEAIADREAKKGRSTRQHPAREIAFPELWHLGPWTEPRLQHDASYLLASSMTSRVCTSCARRPHRASSSTTRTSSSRPDEAALPGIAPDGQELPQRDHAGNFIFRTRSSSRWRWSSSSRRARTRKWHQYWIDGATRWY